MQRFISIALIFRPRVRKWEAELEKVSGAGCSVEYLEKVTGLGEKCRQEWNSLHTKLQVTQINQFYKKKLFV